jgi:hypothetical protein
MHIWDTKRLMANPNKSCIQVSGHRATGTIWKTFCEELGQFETAKLACNSSKYSTMLKYS